MNGERGFSNISIFAAAMLLMIFSSCELLNLPSVETSDVTDITTSSAKCGGTVNLEGGFEVTERGVVWGTTNNPTVIDNKTFDGAGTGSYTSNLTGLDPETEYYVRAYATNEAGTAYGKTVSFKTHEGSSTGGTYTDSRDNNTYTTVTIGNQEWMAENLRYLPSVNGINSSSTTDPRFFVFGYNGSDVAEAKSNTNYSTYGVLYNWPAAMTACPPGWRLPSDDEWKQLEIHLGMSAESADGSNWRGTNQGAMLAGNAVLWSQGTLKTDPDFGSSGFNAFPGGVADAGTYGSFKLLEQNASFYTATEHQSGNAFMRFIDYSNIKVGRAGNDKKYGRSVRCIKN